MSHEWDPGRRLQESAPTGSKLSALGHGHIRGRADLADPGCHPDRHRPSDRRQGGGSADPAGGCQVPLCTGLDPRLEEAADRAGPGRLQITAARPRPPPALAPRPATKHRGAGRPCKQRSGRGFPDDPGFGPTTWLLHHLALAPHCPAPEAPGSGTAPPDSGAASLGTAPPDSDAASPAAGGASVRGGRGRMRTRPPGEKEGLRGRGSGLGGPGVASGDEGGSPWSAGLLVRAARLILLGLVG